MRLFNLSQSRDFQKTAYAPLFADAGARTRTRSTTNAPYTSRPSVSQPMAGNNLKKRLVAVESRDRDACSKFCRKMTRSFSLAACNVCTGGKWLSEVG